MTDMDIYEIRRRNLQHITNEKFPGHGQRTALANFMGWKQPRASAILNGKNIGGVAARNIEQKFSLKRGWLDEAHWPEWEGRQAENIIRESGVEVYPAATSTTLPVVPAELVGDYIAGSLDISRLERWQGIDLVATSGNTFILVEETRALAPMWQPGDVHYVDQDAPAKDGRMAVFVINGRAMAGLFEKGAAGNRLTFSNPHEPVLDVTNATFAGSVTVTFKREFYDQITGA